MNALHAIHLTSIEELRAASLAWDDLWWRSDVALPTARAATVAQWMQQLRPGAPFQFVAVEADGRWIAALPLVGFRIGHLIPAGGLPNNEWSPCGELLLDRDVDADVADAAMDILMASVGRLPWQLLWITEVASETSRWRALLRACDRAGMISAHHTHYCVGRVEIGHDWEAYQKRLPKNHRQAMIRATRRLEAEGNLQFDRVSHCTVSQVRARLQTLFEIENRSWKGKAGTSILGTPGMFDFFVRQAEQLAEWGQLETATLRLNDRTLATLYGFRAKGVFFAHKIGYDPEFAAFSPGQLLFFRLLEQLHGDSDVRALDFMGPINQSLSRWRPATYGVGRIAVALRRPFGSTIINAYEYCWPRFHQLKGRFSSRATAPAAESPAAEPAGV